MTNPNPCVLCGWPDTCGHCPYTVPPFDREIPFGCRANGTGRILPDRPNLQGVPLRTPEVTKIRNAFLKKP